MKKPQKKPPYSLSLNLGGTLHESSGNTMLEALRNLVKPEKIVAKPILTIRKGEQSRVWLMRITDAKRLFFTNTSMQEIKAKVLEVGLK